MDTPSPRPLMLTADPALHTELSRLAAAAHVPVDVRAGVADSRSSWLAAPLVVVGADAAAAVAAERLPRRGDVLLVSAGPEDADLWRLGLRIHADEVVLLPDSQDWLINRLADAADGEAGRASVVSVVGARGGVGVTFWAAALALAGAQGGLETTLVDADPWGGGIDLTVGCESQAGLRWPDIAATEGRVAASALRQALPQVGDLAVLSWDRGAAEPVAPSVMRSMLAAARRGCDLVVADAARVLADEQREAVLTADVVHLVATPDLRSLAGARRALATLAGLSGDVRLVVRTHRGSELSATALAAELDLALAAVLPTRSGASRAVGEGLGPLTRRVYRRRCRAALTQVGGGRPR